MKLIKWNPVNSLDLFRDFDSIIDSVFDRPLSYFRNYGAAWSPRIEVIENDKAYELIAELPGVEKNDIDISVKDGVLTISGEKKDEEKRESENYYCRERRFGKFERSFRMADAVDQKNIKAEFKNGVLKVAIPKVETPESKATKIVIR